MRIVEEKVVEVGTGRLRSGKDTGTDVKEYLDRVSKYVPAEILAAYMTANGVATLAENPGILLAVIVVACLGCIPLYITRFTNTRKEAWVNSLMALVAFIAWAYATGGGLVKYLDWYNGPTASVVLILFSLISGAVVPVTRKRPSKPDLVVSPEK